MSQPLAVTMGDPAGIGPDLIVSVWTQRTELALPPFVVFADPEVLQQRSRALGLSVDMQEVSGTAIATSRQNDDALSVVNTGRAVSHRPGHPHIGNADCTIAAIDAAVAAVAQRTASAIVTAPIAKHVLYGANFKHPGHTEFLGELAERHWPGCNSTPIMMLACDDLLVVPLTVHVPLSDVATLITEALIETTVNIVADALRDRFGIADPRLAIAGLNPHAGEEGTMGTQERDIIEPAVASLRAQGRNVRGPCAADTLFHAAARKTYDAVIAMYHDQALIPIKTIAFDSAVNTTLGLPFVRTSPDHGTAYDIAGSGKASLDSFVAAMRLAARLAQTQDRIPAI